MQCMTLTKARLVEQNAVSSLPVFAVQSFFFHPSFLPSMRESKDSYITCILPENTVIPTFWAVGCVFHIQA